MYDYVLHHIASKCSIASLFGRGLALHVQHPQDSKSYCLLVLGNAKRDCESEEATPFVAGTALVNSIGSADLSSNAAEVFKTRFTIL